MEMRRGRRERPHETPQGKLEVVHLYNEIGEEAYSAVDQFMEYVEFSEPKGSIDDAAEAMLYEVVMDNLREDFDLAVLLLALDYLYRKGIMEISEEDWDRIQSRLPEKPETFEEVYAAVNEAIGAA